MNTKGQHLCVRGRLNSANPSQDDRTYRECCGQSFASRGWAGSPNYYVGPALPDSSRFQPDSIFEPDACLAQLQSSTNSGVPRTSFQEIPSNLAGDYLDSNGAPLVTGTWLPAPDTVALRGGPFHEVGNSLGVAQSPTCVQFATLNPQEIPHNVTSPQAPFPPTFVTLHPVGPNGEMKPSIHASATAPGNMPQDHLFNTSSPVQPMPSRSARRTSRPQRSPLSRRTTTTNGAAPSSQRFYCAIRNCTYARPFARRADLERHIVTQHEHDLPFKRKLFKCPWPACGMGFLRADKMLQHQDRVHESRMT